MFFHTIYISQPTNYFNPLELVQLLKCARIHNLNNDITGLLLYNKKYFFQYIEGSPENIKMLLGKINSDPRHKNLFVLCDGMSEERLFPNWSMGFSDAKSLTDLVDDPNLNSDFIPEEWNTEMPKGYEMAKDLIFRFYHCSSTDQEF